MHIISSFYFSNPNRILPGPQEDFPTLLLAGVVGPDGPRLGQPSNFPGGFTSGKRANSRETPSINSELDLTGSEMTVRAFCSVVREVHCLLGLGTRECDRFNFGCW